MDRRRHRESGPPILRVACLLALAAPPGLAQDTARPNVLLIAIDDLNDWVGCLGDGHPGARTPNIDRLASEGTLFTNAHCQAPVCGPSRASMWTGLRPSTTGIYGQVSSPRLAEHPRVAGNPRPYLSSWFAAHGYRTAAVGKLFHSDGGKGAFDEYGGRLGMWGPKPERRLAYTPPGGKGTQTDWGPYPDSDAEMPDSEVADWAIARLGEAGSEPFFLAVGFWRPHVPWHVPQAWFDLHPLAGIDLPPILDEDLDDLPGIAREGLAMPMMPQLAWMREHDQVGAATQAYLACTTFVDAQIGRVLDALRQSPHAEHTVVVLWSDHGYHLGEKHRWSKHSLWEEATRVPLVVAGPGVPAGRRVDAAAGLIDIYPTLLELAGLPANPEVEGSSLAALMSDEPGDAPRFAVTTYGFGNHAVRDRRFRYIRYEDGSEELYDHDADPHEWHNLASEADYRDQVERLRAALPGIENPWYAHSSMGAYPYFVDNKARHSD